MSYKDYGGVGMYLGRDDEKDVQVKDVERVEEEASDNLWGLFSLSMIGLVGAFVWMIATGVFYFIAVERLLDLLHFEWSIWLMVVVAFVSFLLIGTLGNVIGVRLTEGVSAFGLLSVLSVFDGASMVTLILMSIGIMLCTSLVVLLYERVWIKSSVVFRKKNK